MGALHFVINLIGKKYLKLRSDDISLKEAMAYVEKNPIPFNKRYMHEPCPIQTKISP